MIEERPKKKTLEKISKHQFPSYLKRKDVQRTSAEAQMPETSIAYSKRSIFYSWKPRRYDDEE